MSAQLENPNSLAAFTVFETATLWPGGGPTPPTLPPLTTAQDLLDWVLDDPSRNRNQRSNEASAVKWLGRIDDTPLSAIPLEVRYLVDDRIKRIRNHKPLKKVRRSNIITLLNQVLCRAGILKVGSRRGGITSHSWTQLINSVPGKDARVSLSSLGKFCSSRRIEPHEVTLAIWDAFANETLLHSSFKNPRATLQKTLKASNSARATVPDWPLPEFPPLVNPRLVSIPKNNLPELVLAGHRHLRGEVEHSAEKHLRRQLAQATVARHPGALP